MPVLTCGLLLQLSALSEYHIHQLNSCDGGNGQRYFPVVGLVYAQKVGALDVSSAFENIKTRTSRV